MKKETLYYATDKFGNAEPFDTLEEAQEYCQRRMTNYAQGFGPSTDPKCRITKVEREAVEDYHFEKGVGTVVTPAK